MGISQPDLLSRIWRWVWQGADDSQDRKAAWRVRRAQSEVAILQAAMERGEDVADQLGRSQKHLEELRQSQRRGNGGAFVCMAFFAAAAAFAAGVLADFHLDVTAIIVASLIIFLLAAWRLQRTLTRIWAGRLLDTLTVLLILAALTMLAISVGKMRPLLTNSEEHGLPRRTSPLSR
ncbi:MAG: hypothetical protein ABFD92_16355 [Planctomycetaceae bacterium]